ncbi:leucine-rich repeat domain-containing protein [Sutcliffiella cohnii]
MKKIRNAFIIFIMLCFVGLIWFIAYTISSEPIIQNKAFEEAVRGHLNIPNGEFQKEQVELVEALDLRDSNLESLEGIEYFTSLSSLKVSGNRIKDLSPLKKLNKLIELDLSYNEIEDLSPLLDLKELQVLNVRGNQISDLTPITTLSNLKELNIRENRVNNLEALRHMYALEDLNARYNYITSIEALSNLQHLRKRLYLNGNAIVDYSPVASYINEINDHDLGSIPPRFSITGGFYGNDQLLSLSYYDQEARIFYTLDGSDPDPVNNPNRTHEYSEPIQFTNKNGEGNKLSTIRTANDGSATYWKEPAEEVNRGSVVRARAVLSDGTPTDIETHTYFIGIEHYSLPVISIATNEENFFDPQKGIYVNGNWSKSGDDWERKVNFEYYLPDGTRELSQVVGTRIHGGWSRNAPMKTLRLYARDEYGTNLMYYDFFNDPANMSHKRLLLRNSGNDFHRTLFKDALTQRLVQHLSLDTQAFQPSIVFINGEYWGIHNIRERFDTWYLSNKYGGDRDMFTILQTDGSNIPIVDDGSEVGVTHFEEFLLFIKTTDLSSPGAYAQLN